MFCCFPFFCNSHLASSGRLPLGKSPYIMLNINSVIICWTHIFGSINNVFSKPNAPPTGVLNEVHQHEHLRFGFSVMPMPVVLVLYGSKHEDCY